MILDFETRSVVDLSAVGSWVYSRHPSTGVWCASIRESPWGDVEVRRDLDSDIFELPPEVIEYLRRGGEVWAHHAAFEYHVLRHVLKVPVRWNQFHCTMAMAYAMALPGALGRAVYALGGAEDKDQVGRAIMLRMCRPTNLKDCQVKGAEPNWLGDGGCEFTFMGAKITQEAALALLSRYCHQDTKLTVFLRERLRPLSPFQRKVFLAGEVVNDRGMALDTGGVRAAISLRNKAKILYGHEMALVTKGRVQGPSKVGQLKAFIEEKTGVPVPTLAAHALPGVKRAALNCGADDVVRAIELRALSSRITSTSKLDSMLRAADADSRVRRLYQYHGAATGRWAGRLVQPHNITRDLPKPKTVEGLMKLIRCGDPAVVDTVYGDPVETISRILRGFVVAPEGSVLIGGDWSNVEGRALAWLAGDDGTLDLFRAADRGEGPDVYVATYAEVFGVDPATVTSDQRQVGKVIVLSMGYGGGVGAFHTMAKGYGVQVTDAVADRIKHAWRQAHPQIVGYWRALERAAIQAVVRPGRPYAVGPRDRQVAFACSGGFLWCRLPSGRQLCYPEPEVRQSRYGPALTYMTVPSADVLRRNSDYDDPRSATFWLRVDTYGGKLAENATQAACADILMEKMVEMEERGLPVVMHTHDEIISEVRAEGAARRKADMARVMNTPPIWARGLPLVSELWVAKRYIKP